MFTGRSKIEIPVTLKLLCDSLYTTGALLTELDLSDNAIGPVGFPGIEKFLSSEAVFNLQTLNLNNCGMGSAVINLSKCLSKCSKKAKETGRCLALKKIILGRNRLENAGAIAMAKAIKVCSLLLLLCTRVMRDRSFVLC